MIKAFIFDLDGTLIHALPDIQANINQALANLGYDQCLSLEETQPHVGGGAHKLASNVLGLPMENEDVMALYHEFADVYEKNPAAHGYPFPQVMDTLAQLQARGIKLSVVTAKPAKARVQVLTKMGFDPLLVAALSPEDGYLKKPAPDMLLECCKRMDVSPSETWMIGDTLFDVEAGLNAKCAGVGFAMHGYQDVPEQYKDQVTCVHHFSEILELI